MTGDLAVRELREHLNEIAAVDDCAACACLLAIAAQALAGVRRIPGEEARDAEDDLRRLLIAGRDAAHPCLGCDDCLPVESYHRFRGRLAALGVATHPGPGAPPAGTPPACAGCDCSACE